MSYNQSFKTFTVSIVSGDSLTSSLKLGNKWATVYALMPSLGTASAFEVFGSPDDTTFNRVMHPPINSSTVATNAFQIASQTTGWVKIPADFPYIKIRATAAAADGATFKVICSY